MTDGAGSITGRHLPREWRVILERCAIRKLLVDGSQVEWVFRSEEDYPRYQLLSINEVAIVLLRKLRLHD